MTTFKKLFLTVTLSGLAFGPAITFADDGSDQADPAQFARGAKAWADQCGRCHNVRSPSELNDEDWHVSTTHMRVVGNIPGDVIRDIQVFLKASNDKK